MMEFFMLCEHVEILILIV